MVGVCVVALILAVAYRQRARRAAVLILLAAVLAAGASVAAKVLYTDISVWVLDRVMRRERDMEWASAVAECAISAVQAAGLVLLVLAAFAGRRRQE
jgi:MYXO-CTERM domain-containing protein